MKSYEKNIEYHWNEQKNNWWRDLPEMLDVLVVAIRATKRGLHDSWLNLFKETDLLKLRTLYKKIKECKDYEQSYSLFNQIKQIINSWSKRSGVIVHLLGFADRYAYGISHVTSWQFSFDEGCYGQTEQDLKTIVLY